MFDLCWALFDAFADGPKLKNTSPQKLFDRVRRCSGGPILECPGNRKIEQRSAR